MSKPDPRKTRAWRKLRDRVVEEEPECRLAYPGICTQRSTTADHIQPVSKRLDLALVRTNLRGACEPCNRERSNKPDGVMPGAQAPRARALSIFRTV